MKEVNEELYQKALEILPEWKENNVEFSINKLQRRFRTGYIATAKVVERLESEGFVTGYDGSNPRKILKVK